VTLPWTRAGAALAAAVTLSLAGVGTAHATDRSGSSDARGKTAVDSFVWHVRRDSSGRSEGYFSAQAIMPANLLLALQGPATCVDIEGNAVGFLYMISDNSRPSALRGQYILYTGIDNGGGGRDRLGFVGPAPRAVFGGCSPRPQTATLPVDGHIAVRND
jgi:hypothetical protein